MTVILLACLERDAAPAAIAPLLDDLGIAPAPGPDCRAHGPFLWSLRVPEVDQERVDRLAAMPGVRSLRRLPDAGRLSAPDFAGHRSVVPLRDGIEIGGGAEIVIAGPCSIESLSHAVETAEIVAGSGAQALRGGVFKPRTMPYDFGGLGARGLEYMAEAARRWGLAVVTEALDPGNLDVVAEYADVVQIGSRNMHNSTLLFQAGAHPAGRPVLLKRGFGATVDEFIGAAEYVLLGRLAAGHDGPGVILCERGIRTFEQSTRFTLDIAAVPVLRRASHLPVMCDPSHAAGHRDLVLPLALASMAAGADGLLVEVHPDPARAWSDGSQCIDGPALGDLIARCVGRSRAAGPRPAPVPP